jgi:uncharacterized ubiquitin-like protein YukD
LVTNQNINQQIIEICKIGGEIILPKKEFIIDQTLRIENCNNVTIKGNETTLVFPDDNPIKTQITQVVKENDKNIFVSNTSTIEIGRKYQIYKNDKTGDRLLEFVVTNKNHESITLQNPVKFMTHVNSIDIGDWIILERNFIEINNSNNITISNLNFNGKSSNIVRGHTIFSGILVENSFATIKNSTEIISETLTIENCNFENLSGRAIAVYATNQINIDNCRAQNVRAEAFEIDHMSSGIIQNSFINEAEIGIQLNDAFNSIVRNNEIQNTKIGINIITHFDHDWLNTNNTITDNNIDASETGVFIGNYAKTNIISDNFFQRKQITGKLENNQISNNSSNEK